MLTLNLAKGATVSRFFYFISLCSFLILSPAHGAVDYSVCPDVKTLAPNVYDPAVSLEDVMHQFRDHIEVADQAVSDGKMGTLANNELVAAVENVEAAHNCAELVVRNASHTMTPDSIQSLPPAQQGPALDGFSQAMQQFADLLTKYEEALAALRDAPPASRNFSAASDLQMQIHSFESQAHKQF